MSQAGSNQLKKNFNDWAITSLINNAKAKEHPVMGWKIVGGKKEIVDVNFHIIRKFRNEIVVRANSPQTKDQLTDLSVGAQNLNFYLPEDLVLFQSTVKKIEVNGDVVIEFPEFIAQVDRRKHMRLFIENGIRSEIFFTKENHGQRVRSQAFQKGCFDISAGGLSFIISKTEKKFFEVGDGLYGLQLEIDDFTIHLNGQVVNILEVEPNARNGLIYKGWKISVKFTSIALEAQKMIDDFVFSHVDIEEAG